MLTRKRKLGKLSKNVVKNQARIFLITTSTKEYSINRRSHTFR